MKSNTTKKLIPLFFLIILGSCKKSYWEEERTAYLDALAKVELGCEEKSIVWHFSALLNGNKICYYDGIDDYFSNTSLSGFTMTKTGSFSGEDTANIVKSGKHIGFGITAYPEHLKEHIVFFTPEFPSTTNYLNIAETSFKLGELPLQANLQGSADDFFDTTGFNIFLSLPVKNLPPSQGYSEHRIESRLGNQDNSRLEIVKLNKFEMFGNMIYDIEMELECNLYHKKELLNRELYGRLEDGKLVMQLVIKKE